MISHIQADDLLSAIYGQGFVHAQTRLWNMEKTRRMARGELAEIFGPDVLLLDKFMRAIGIRRTYEEKIQIQQLEDVLQAYADGVNDYVAGVGIFSDESTGRILPPEFITFGITKENFVPWQPTDTLSIICMISLRFTGNWNQDLLREALRQLHPELLDLVEEIKPFTSEFLTQEEISIVDDDDLKEWGLYSEESIVERYKASREKIADASPPIKSAKILNS